MSLTVRIEISLDPCSSYKTGHYQKFPHRYCRHNYCFPRTPTFPDYPQICRVTLCRWVISDVSKDNRFVFRVKNSERKSRYGEFVI